MFPYVIRLESYISQDYPDNKTIDKWLLENIGMGNWGNFELTEDSDKWFRGYVNAWHSIAFRNECDYKMFIYMLACRDVQSSIC